MAIAVSADLAIGPDGIGATKLAPPKSLDWHIRRNKLLAKLDQISSQRPGIVSAPAGYGKSTLLGQWRAHQITQGKKVAWLTLDDLDSDPDRFFASITSALGSTARSMSVFAEEIGRDPAGIVLVLDDYHRASSSDTDAALDMLVAAAPCNLGLVVGTRSQAHLVGAATPSAGNLVVIESEELRFTLAEAGVFFKATDEDFPDDYTLMLWHRAEGWPMALQIARQWMGAGADRIAEIDAFSGRTLEMWTYISERLMLGLSSHVQSFLLETSILEQFDGEIANTVCGRDDGWQIIAELERLNTFLTPMDGEGRWHRYHHLFADFLRERLRRDNSARLLELHRNAANWHAARGHLSQAVRHAIDGNDPELLAEIVENAGGWRLVFAGQIAVLRAAIDYLTAPVLEAKPRIALAQIYLSSKAGRVAFAKRKLKQWDADFHDLSKLCETLPAERFVVGKFLSGYHDTLAFHDDIVEVSGFIENLPVHDDIVLALLHNYLCTYYFDICDFDKAQDSSSNSVQYFEASGHEHAFYVLHLYRGQILFARGDLEGASQILGETSEAVKHSPIDNRDASAISSALLAEALYERGDLDGANALLEEALPHLEQFDGWFDVYAPAYMTAAALAYHRQDLEASLAVLYRAEATADRRLMPRLRMLVRARRLSFFTLSGRIDLAQRLAEELVQESDSSLFQSIRVRHERDVALARLAIHTGQEREATALLMPMLDDADRLGWARESIRLSILLSTSCANHGDRGRSAFWLDKALVMAAPGRFTRTFLDEGSKLLDLLKAASSADAALSYEGKRQAKRILAAGAQNGSPDLEFGPNQLSSRERDVMLLIGAGYSNKQTAFELGITESTVKFHLQNVYAKLGVGSRSQALAKARNLSLI